MLNEHSYRQRIVCLGVVSFVSAFGLIANAQLDLGEQQQPPAQGEGGRESRPLFQMGNPNGFIPPVMSIHDRSKEINLGDDLLIVPLRDGDLDGLTITENSFFAFEFNVFTPEGELLYTTRQPGHRAASAKVPNGTMFPAWEKAMMGIPLNGVRKIYIPAELGPGPDGFGPLPGNQPLVIEAGVFDIAPPLVNAKEGDGFRYIDITEGEGDPLEPAGFASCHLTVFDEEANLMGSTRLTRQPIGTPGNADRYWVKFALGMKSGGSRVIEFDEPEAYRKLSGAPTSGTPDRWRMVIHTRTVHPPIVQTAHNPSDERPINDDGVRVVDLVEGEGETMPEEGFTPIVHYSIWYADNGKLYDSTHKPGQTQVTYSSGLHPAPIKLALKGMKKGGKRKMIVPAGFRIPDDFSTLPLDRELVYEIELLGWEENIFTLEGGGGGELIFTDVETGPQPDGPKPPSKP